MKRSWADAEEFCQQEGGNLVSVTSEAINEHIYKEKKRRDLSWLWLGGSDQEKEGVWKWSDGSLWEINNWNLGEPSNQTGQHCLSQAYYSQKWNDYSCNAKINFVCSQTLQSGKITLQSPFLLHPQILNNMEQQEPLHQLISQIHACLQQNQVSNTFWLVHE